MTSVPRTAIAIVALLATVLTTALVPAERAVAREATDEFPHPVYWVSPSYEDALGLHVLSDEPIFGFDVTEDPEPADGYHEFTLELELSHAGSGEPPITTSIEPLSVDGGWSYFEWGPVAGAIQFDEDYVLRYRVVTEMEAGDWTELAFSVVDPLPAPVLLSPLASELEVAGPVELSAQLPDGFIAGELDSIVFRIESSWMSGEPTLLEEAVVTDTNGIARATFDLDDGIYFWSAQWVGSGYAEPSDTRELRVSRPALAIQNLSAYTNVAAETEIYWDSQPQTAPVDHFDVVIMPGDIAKRVDGNSHGTDFSYLSPGSYTATVTATNALGTSPMVSVSFVVQQRKPLHVADLRATAEGNTLNAEWDPPVFDGGSPVLEYTLEVRSSIGNYYRSITTSDLSAALPVEPGREYRVTVTPRNALGAGAPWTELVTVYAPASEPLDVQVRSGDGHLDIFWSTPISSGGGWITKYQVEVDGVGTFFVDQTYTPRHGIHLVDLENDAAYSVSIRAVHEGGPGVAAQVEGTPSDSNLDTDADGLPDLVETRFGTSSQFADSDGDGLLDVDEALKLAAFLAPTLADTDGDGVSDADEDTDGDGVTNISEIGAGTNPSAPDSDHDGLLDLDELSRGTNPAAADSDGDGVEDRVEIAVQLDPLVVDSDADGISDGSSIVALTLAEPTTAGEGEEHVSLPEVGRVSAAVVGTASRVDDVRVATAPSDGLVGALTVAAIVYDSPTEDADTGPVPMGFSTLDGAPPSASSLTFGFADGVSPDRLEELAPVVWNEATSSWEFADNEVSISTAAHTITVSSPELGMTYAIVDLRSWRAHVTQCDSGKTGRPQLDVEFVIDETPSVLASDDTEERFRAAKAILDTLRPGDRATVRAFGLLGIIASRGTGSSANYWMFRNSLPDPYIGAENLWGLNSLELAKVRLDALEEDRGPNDYTWLPGGDAAWDVDEVLAMRAFEADERNPYVPAKRPLSCSKRIVVLITDGQYGGVDYGSGSWGAPPFEEAGVPVHVLDLGTTGSISAQWMIDLADATDGSYSYVPTDADLASWIDDVSPPAWPAGDPDQDSDGDTLPDMVETYGITSTFTERGDGARHRFFSDPFSADSDSDGIPDNAEIRAKLPSGAGGATWGGINRAYVVVSDPASVDGDSDGLDDRSEVESNMNPLNADPDHDGLSDSEEEMWGTFGQLYDTDSDGFSDLFEVRNEADGYDPWEMNKQVSEFEWLNEAAIGFFCGEVDICSMSTIPWLVGNLASGLLVFGDLRDAIALTIKGDYVAATFCAVGLVPAIGDAAGSVAKVLKFIRKLTNPLGLRVAAVTSVGNLATTQALRLLAQYAGTASKFVDELAKFEPDMVDALRGVYNASDEAIQKIVIGNGIYRIRAYTSLSPVHVKRYAYPAGVTPGPKATGRAGELAMQSLVPGLAGYTQTAQAITTPKGPALRFWDGRLSEPPRYFESKVGYVASAFAGAQLAKDIAWKSSHSGTYEWHFWMSDVTGKIGPSLPKLQQLIDNGFIVVFHFPQELS